MEARSPGPAQPQHSSATLHRAQSDKLRTGSTTFFHRYRKQDPKRERSLLKVTQQVGSRSGIRTQAFSYPMGAAGGSLFSKTIANQCSSHLSLG